jgi:hypothetical protein
MTWVIVYYIAFYSKMSCQWIYHKIPKKALKRDPQVGH